MIHKEYPKKYSSFKIDAGTLKRLRELSVREGTSIIGEVRLMIQERHKFLDKREWVESHLHERKAENRLIAEAKI